jgi:predicted lipoprotein with Yx(FWY)xxD motif
MRRLGVLGVAVGPVVLVAAACGSSSSTKAAPATGASAAKTGAAATVVSTKHDAKLGTILADSKGLTLYTLTSAGQPVPCTGPCLSVWPPLEVPTGVTPTGAAGVVGLGTTPAPGGNQLVTFQGKPLYRFATDKDSGDAYGQGIKSFGGVWSVQQLAAAASSASAGGGGK